MKKRIITGMLIAGAALCVAARDLVIFHTNDTHSLILPDADGKGGVLQRKAIIDSVKGKNKDVLLIDAGDKVQGTLYFKFFKGDVEYPLQNMLGVDISILGNHEFDNGLQALADKERMLKTERLSANYDFAGTPAEGLFKPYAIKNIGGKKVGFLGINIDPESIIAQANYEGMGFKDVIKTANETAAFLREKKKCDLVVAVTHIGYTKGNDKTTDPELARASKDIDIIIGGHSHTLIDPENPDKYPSIVENAEGRPVLIVQTGKSGKYIGQIRVDLDKLKASTPADYEYSLIEVTDRFPDDKLDPKIKQFLQPFTDSLENVKRDVIGYATQDFLNDGRTGAFPNWTADFGSWYGSLVLDSLRQTDPATPRLDFAIMNVGGIRNPIPQGPVTAGQILSTYPFSNHFVIMRISGKDILETLNVAAKKGGEAVSHEVTVVCDGDRNVEHVLLDMKEIDPEKTYTVATIDYVAWGNDDMRSMANGEWIYCSENEVSEPIIRYMKELTRLGLPMRADQNARFIYKSQEQGK
ncbi:MAG: bifunctional metallophosphatase/5'-nucleotidase [Muribaculaceae bacterium]|nr:bifunctional metallophosphatase/5'-nucleotidase [Muribaculaceae bacterium]